MKTNNDVIFMVNLVGSMKSGPGTNSDTSWYVYGDT